MKGYVITDYITGNVTHITHGTLEYSSSNSGARQLLKEFPNITGASVKHKWPGHTCQRRASLPASSILLK